MVSSPLFFGQTLTANLDCQSDGSCRTTADLLDVVVDVFHSDRRRWTVSDGFFRDS